jgi:P27 family predicted phage terminase small subunit
VTIAGKGGRPRKPTALKLLQGDRQDRINRDEPVPDEAEVVRPEWLPEPAAAIWDQLAPDLIAKNVLTAWDVDMFAAFCTAVVANREAAADLDQSGVKCTTLVRETARGDLIYDLRRNPAWQVFRESAATMAGIGGKFGLTPADRAGLSVGQGEQHDPTADLLTAG